jgi:carbon storage regulator
VLVLSRRVDESVHLGDSIMVRILSIQGGHVRLGLIAPSEIRILRSELVDQLCAASPLDRSISRSPQPLPSELSA